MKSTNVISCSFALALTVFEILTFQIFDLEKVRQGHGVQHWQCRSQIANVKMYKRHFLQSEYRLDLTCAHDCYKHTQELHDIPMAIGKSTDLPRNTLIETFP